MTTPPPITAEALQKLRRRSEERKTAAQAYVENPESPDAARRLEAANLARELAADVNFEALIAAAERAIELGRQLAEEKAAHARTFARAHCSYSAPWRWNMTTTAINDPAACACLHVMFHPIDNPDGSKSERWECTACASVFVRSRRVAELEAENEKLRSGKEHCSTCICGRRAPVQEDRQGVHPAEPVKPQGWGPGTIAWSEHLLAYQDYARRYGTRQSAERLAERGGFGYGELVDHLGYAPKTWEPIR